MTYMYMYMSKEYMYVCVCVIYADSVLCGCMCRADKAAFATLMRDFLVSLREYNCDQWTQASLSLQLEAQQKEATRKEVCLHTLCVCVCVCVFGSLDAASNPSGVSLCLSPVAPCLTSSQLCRRRRPQSGT